MFEPIRQGGRLTGFRMPAAERSLTWRQVLAFLAGLAALIFGIMAYGQGADLDPVRGIGKIGLVIAGLICIAFTAWHLRLVRRPDVYPDILATLVHPDAILELGQCHLSFGARPRRGGVEITGLVQNLTDGPGTLKLNFVPPMSLRSQTVFIPGLECVISPASVVKVSGVFPLAPGTGPQRVHLDGSFEWKGKQIRFARRRALTGPVPAVLTAGLLLAGHLHAGGGVFLTLASEGGEPAAECDGTWTTTLVWSPEGPDSIAINQIE